MERKRIYVDMDGTLCDFEKDFYRDLAVNPSIKYPQSQYRFWANLEPIPGAIEGFKKLEEKYDVRILTAPSNKNIICYTEKAEWVRTHLGFDALKKLILTKDKSIAIGDYLIDDRTVNGAAEFKGELIHIFTPKFPDWESIINYLIHLK